MKKRSFFLLLIFISAYYRAHTQILNFVGTAPSLSFTAVPAKNLDINFLVTSKLRVGDYTIKEEQFNTKILEIYSQALASYGVDKHFQISAGYGFQRNNPLDNNWRNEHRLVQQVMYATAKESFKFYNRFRFEERWFSYPIASDEFGTRARYLVGIIKKLDKKNTYWQLNDEIYAITSGRKNALISENWIYTGIGFGIKPLGRLETGIGYNSVVRNNNRDLMNLLLIQVNWSYIIPAPDMKTMHPVMHSRNF
jgi:hypothetical protein